MIVISGIHYSRSSREYDFLRSRQVKILGSSCSFRNIKRYSLSDYYRLDLEQFRSDGLSFWNTNLRRHKKYLQDIKSSPSSICRNAEPEHYLESHDP
jgi:hypothetical protein